MGQRGQKAGKRSVSRFGIGEWYGRPFTTLSRDERRDLARIQSLPKGARPSVQCPFLSSSTRTVSCWKEGGVCSIRKYDISPDSEVAVFRADPTIRTTCPSRFEENRVIHRWIGQVILGDPDALAIGQVSFLRRVPPMATDDSAIRGREEVGRIDNILITPQTSPLQWCAVEIQAVYFSGDSMARDFEQIMSHEDATIPFPAGRRRPDYRSSGPKRLMPQLQIKVPTLRRWGKKMAVVVDDQFFKAMGKMNTVEEMSNCDVAWFVVKYSDSLNLVRGRVYLTTLEDSIESLVAGRPVSLPEFEERILAKLTRLRSGPTEVSPD